MINKSDIIIKSRLNELIDALACRLNKPLNKTTKMNRFKNSDYSDLSRS